MKAKRIGITIGDPAGVGTQILQAALAGPLLDQTADYRIIGDATGHQPGVPTPASARAAWDALVESKTLVLSGEIDALVTCPISKAAMTQIGFPYPGHTEFFATEFQCDDEVTMILTGDTLTVGLATIHIPVCKIAHQLTKPAILKAGRHLVEFMNRLHPDKLPRIAVAGLNPHAGESGTIGTEELQLIRPAVQTLQTEHLDTAIIDGPFSPDTIFHRAAKGDWDAVLCMYHDQGLIPLKLLDFHSGVNLTWGLPFIRTSPDHGTAYDLAASGAANPQSLICAINLAARLA